MTVTCDVGIYVHSLDISPLVLYVMNLLNCEFECFTYLLANIPKAFSTTRRALLNL